MSRLPPVSRAALSSEQQAIWDNIAAVRSPAMAGPFSALMHLPELASRVAHLEDFFRFEGALPAADRELIIMATAREYGARYPWSRHEARGREAGTRVEAIEAVRALGPLAALTDRERLLVELVRSLVRAHALPDELYRRAETELGQKVLVETVALIGHYSLISLVVDAFCIEPPEGTAPTF